MTYSTTCLNECSNSYSGKAANICLFLDIVVGPVTHQTVQTIYYIALTSGYESNVE